jgi:hypothetical protein
MLEEEEEDFRGSFFNTAGGAVANIFGLAETGWNAAPSVYADMMNPQAKMEQRKQSLMNERFKVGLSQQLICSHSNGVSHSEAVTRSKQERKKEREKVRFVSSCLLAGHKLNLFLSLHSCRWIKVTYLSENEEMVVLENIKGVK